VQAAITRCKLPTVRCTCPAANLWTLAIVSLLYLLLAVPCTHRSHSPGAGHDTLEIVHLPPGASGNDADAVRIVQDLWPSDLTVDQVTGSTPKSGDPALAALICAVGLVILAFFFSAATIPVFFRTAEAVLGVGRWHRAVVLLL
jgi:hypothetical protein